MSRTPEQHLVSFLESLEGTLRGKTVLVAVSGGADSVALLVLLHRFSRQYGYALHAVTVNHMIRPESESSGDAEFVRSLCESLAPPVPCTVIRLERGEVDRLASSRRGGIEEAARHARYRIFEETADKVGSFCIMTAHNRNDRNETMLMRFFQGAAGRSLAGIRSVRGRYARPLLDCTHEELTDFLVQNGYGWREDGTNADDRYLRNRIRLHLVPVLDRYLPGWETGMRSGAEKSTLDEDLARSLITAVWRRSGSGIECPADAFFSMHPAVRLRFLRDGLDLIATGGPVFGSRRIPGGYLLSLATLKKPENGRQTAASGLAFRVEGNTVFWGPDIVQNTKSGYLVYICRSGTYRLPCGDLAVSGSGRQVYLDGRLGPFSLPLVVRSRSGGDTVRTSEGRQKTLKKLMNDWSVPDDIRNLVPLVEQDGEIRAVYGSLLGYPDWYVQR